MNTLSFLEKIIFVIFVIKCRPFSIDVIHYNYGKIIVKSQNYGHFNQNSYNQYNDIKIAKKE